MDKLPRWFKADCPGGRFSRRHQTSEANATARERYHSNRGKRARQQRAQTRLETRQALTDLVKGG